FFSSRRRHTRSKRDWSSDVCSSDLPGNRKQEDMSGNPRNVDRRAACAGPVPERALRAVVAVLLGGFAVSMIRVSPIAAITVGVIAIGIATVALTGRCPLDTFPSRRSDE